MIVDAYSKWPEIIVTKDMTSQSIKQCLRQLFSRFGIAEVLVSDNGPSLISKDLNEWLANIGCLHLTSPDYHPKSNGLAEKMVRTVKEHTKINWAKSSSLQESFDRFLLSYRNVPHSTTHMTPSEMVFNRTIRTTAPALASSGYSLRPLQRTYEFGDVIQQEGRVITLQNSQGDISRRHIEQFKPLSNSNTFRSPSNFLVDSQSHNDQLVAESPPSPESSKPIVSNSQDDPDREESTSGQDSPATPEMSDESWSFIHGNGAKSKNPVKCDSSHLDFEVQRRSTRNVKPVQRYMDEFS